MAIAIITTSNVTIISSLLVILARYLIWALVLLLLTPDWLPGHQQRSAG